MNIFTSDPDTWEVQAAIVQWEARKKHAHCPLPTPLMSEKIEDGLCLPPVGSRPFKRKHMEPKRRPFLISSQSLPLSLHPLLSPPSKTSWIHTPLVPFLLSLFIISQVAKK